MSHFVDALSIIPLIGVQGKHLRVFSATEVITVPVGLLLARAYAVTDHKQLVLSVLDILGIGAIGPALVCTQVHFCDWCL